MTRAYERFANLMALAVERSVSSGSVARLPDGGGVFMEIFAELSAGRHFNDAGAQAITWAELAAWQQVAGVTLQPHHLSVLRAMDAALLRAVKKKRAGQGLVSKSPLSAGLFDVLA